MSNIKDKLIDIAKEIIINNADCSEIAEDIITLDEFGYDNACEEIADSIIEKLPKLLEDSEWWVKLPNKNEYKQLQKQLLIVTKAFEDMCEEFDKDIDCPCDGGCTSDKPCYLCTIKYKLAEAEEELAELKGVKENE